MPALGDFRDSRWAGVRTCFQLPAVLTTPANRASPPEVPAAPPAVTGMRSQFAEKRPSAGNGPACDAGFAARRTVAVSRRSSYPAARTAR